MRTLYLILVLWFPSHLCQSQTVLDSILDARPHAWWGAMVTDLAKGDTLFMRNAERSFIPASVTKLFTTSAALDQLGPNFRYVTKLYAQGVQTDGSLEGNLIVQGAGDPSTGAPGPNWMNVFNAFADSIQALGISEIQGDLIGDDNVFDDLALGADWSWEDLSFGYAAQISGLTFYDATVDVYAYPTTPGAKAKLSIIPDPGPYLKIENQTRTLPRRSKLVEDQQRIAESNRIILSSQVPMGRSDLEVISVHNPTLYFVHGLHMVLTSRGIRVQGQPRDIDEFSQEFTYPDARVIARHTSSALSDLAATINKESHNLYAEHLLKTLGRARPASDESLEPGSAVMGVAAAMRTYTRAQIDSVRVQLVDGSGLSRKNLVSPSMTIALLRYMALHSEPDVRDAFTSSLAIGGQDGTLEYRFVGKSAGYGRVRAKTGTLGNVTSLAGYITHEDEPRLAFVLFANHFQGGSAEIRKIQDSFVNALILSLPQGNE